MASGGNGILSIGKDVGEVKFAVDLSTGLVYITVRAPLAIEGVTSTMDVLQFLDHAAQTTLELNKQHRAMIEKLRAGGLG